VKVQIFDELGIEIVSVWTGLDLSILRIDVSKLPASAVCRSVGFRVNSVSFTLITPYKTDL